MLAGAAGYLDYRTRRIPNWLVLSGLILGVGLNSFLYGTQGLWVAVQGCGLALLIYLPLFALRAMGGGDAKLMAAIGSLVGPGNWLVIFFITALLGGFFAIVFVVSRKLLGRTLRNIWFILGELIRFRAPHHNREELSAGHEKALSMPHGAVIAVGVAMFLAAVRTATPHLIPAPR
jgi:prepilin peptidase CpaA